MDPKATRALYVTRTYANILWDSRTLCRYLRHRLYSHYSCAAPSLAYRSCLAVTHHPPSSALGLSDRHAGTSWV